MSVNMLAVQSALLQAHACVRINDNAEYVMMRVVWVILFIIPSYFQPTYLRHFGLMSLFLESIFVFCFKITLSHASIIFKCINAYWLHAIFTIHIVHPWHFLFITYAFLYEYIIECVMKMSQPVKGGISKYALMLSLFTPFREVN